MTSVPMLELEEAECCMCGSREGTPRLSGTDVEFRTCANRFTFLACSRCRHLFLSPRPRMQDMSVVYSNYLTTNRESAYHPSPLISSIKDRFFDARRMRPVLSRLSDGSNVLDIGVGMGRLLKLIRRLRETSVRLYANEITFDGPTREALQREGIGLLEGPIEHCETALQFDAITGVHILEHVLDPRAVLAWIAAHLRPGGVLYLETPDTGALCAKLFGASWGMTHFPRHVNLFSKRDLAELVVSVGLRIAHHGNTTSAPAWNMSIRNCLGMDALSRHRSPLELFNYSNPLTLAAFTLVDLALMTVRIPTSTQQIVALKP